MSKFNVGDRVRIASIHLYGESKHQGLVVGNTGTVAHVLAHGLLIKTDNAKEPTDSGGAGWFFHFGDVTPLTAEVAL